MKKRKISLIIIAIAMALCMVLFVILPACSGGDKDEDNEEQNQEQSGGDVDPGAGGDDSGSGNEGSSGSKDVNQEELPSTTIYMVGDSTMCSFTDTIYIPRYGYGTQMYNYFYDAADYSDAEGATNDSKVTIRNLAMSGRSSQTFLSENNYTTLKNSIQEGDYLIIGFGHNDEKSGDTFTSANLGLGESTDTTISFQDSLYDNYVALAEEVGATPILCTPIVRYSESGNYSGSNGHVTSDGGDYPQAIRDLGKAKGVTVIDLTATTAADYGAIGDDAVWYHSYNSAELVEDDSTDPMARVIKDENGEDVTVVPSGMDGTHLNKYGAKMVAYEFATELAKTDNPLADYISADIVKPTMASDFGEDVYYDGYVYVPYTAFNPDTYSSVMAASNAQWSGFPVTDSSNNTWYATEFGDVGGASHISSTEFTISQNNGVFTVGNGSGDSRGKLTSGGDGLACVFMQLSADDNFTATASVKVTNILSNLGSSSPAQTGFGMMLRDDIYINKYSKTIDSDYGVAGILGYNTSYTGFYKLSSSIKKGDALSSPFAVGDEYTVTITRENQTVYMTTKLSDGTEKTINESDLNFYAVDENYIYLCLFATRGVTCEFSNFTYQYTGTAQGA